MTKNKYKEIHLVKGLKRALKFKDIEAAKMFELKNLKENSTQKKKKKPRNQDGAS
ncbi:MAG TPA: hypothetical protein VKY40_04955 [Halanaerobiales bacterium]|nr:hypothetical protein [Halanaerobiales bacterium]